LPYKKYLFLLRDNAYGALEHRDCLTLGAPASELEKDFQPVIADIAHEYFHAWNLVRIRPVELGDPVFKTPPLSRGLWWSEGLTMFYADLLLRRAGLPVYDSTRIAHLEKLIARYYNSPGNQKNVEEVSMAEFAPPGLLGDYIGSTHVQGELLGNMLDLLIRNATKGERSMDDAMRKIFEGFSGEKGFANGDIEQIVSRICGCDVQHFFKDYIKGNRPFDFNAYLQLIGLHATVSWMNAQQDDGKPAPDLRVYAFTPRNQAGLQIGIMDPANCWGEAGPSYRRPASIDQ
jgi:predicted metalloprotease with PDZ domain